MNIAVYARVSTAQQAEHGYSLETQIDACRKKALELGATSIKVYTDDGYSGAYLERPAMDSLRDAVAQKLHDYIIIYDHAQGIKHIESFLMGQKCSQNNLKRPHEHFIMWSCKNAIRTILCGYFFIASSNAWMMNALWLFAPVRFTDSCNLALNPFGTVNFICS